MSPLQYQHGAKRSDHDRVLVPALTARLSEGIGLTVHRWVVLLDTTVVTSPKQHPGSVKESGSNRNATFSQTKPCLLESNVEHRLVIKPVFHELLLRQIFHAGPVGSTVTS